MPGLFLNSYPLELDGVVTFRRISGAALGSRRRELEERYGVAIWTQGSDAFALEDPRNVSFDQVSLPLGSDALSMFAVRNAIVDHCRGLGYLAEVRRANQIEIEGLVPLAVEDMFAVEHVLSLRVTSEDFAEADALLVARHRTSWRRAGTLEEGFGTVGDTVVRLSGDGPSRGRLVEASGSRIRIKHGNHETEALARDYTLAVNAPTVLALRGPAVLHRLRVIAGEFNINGKRNRHGVADRFRMVGNSVRKIGPEIPVGDHGKISVAARPLAIRMESA